MDGRSSPAGAARARGDRGRDEAAHVGRSLFERSEFLIDTSQKKSLRVCTRARSSTSLGLSVSYYVPHTYVSQLGSQDTYM